MKKIIKKLMLLIPIPLIFFMVNYFGDASNTFGGNKYEKQLVQILYSKQNATNIESYDLKQFYKMYGDSMSPATIVMGSSRTQLISNDTLGSNNFLNNSITGATLDSYQYIYSLYGDKWPKTIIIGIDPWIFNVNNYKAVSSSALKKIENSFFNGISKLGLNIRVDNYTELFSPNYFQNSLKKILRSEKTKQTNLACNATRTLHIDGSICYDEKYRQRSNEEVARSAIAYASQEPVFLLGNFTSIDTNLKTEFENLVDDVQKHDIEIIFFLPPYYPKVYELLSRSSRYKIINDVESYLKRLAENKNIKVYGSYNPEGIVESEDFYDGSHLKEDGLKKILEKSLNPQLK